MQRTPDDGIIRGVRGRRGKLVTRLVAASVSLALALGVCEVAVRFLWDPSRVAGRLYFRDATGEQVGQPGQEPAILMEAARRGLVQPLPPDQTPRARYRFSPGARFYLCYEGFDHRRAEWMDDRGCVEVAINRFGLREREELTPDNKAPGERRVVCIGDSFTFGWGIPVEQCWVRLLEGELRPSLGDVRTINCGASGAITADEYWWGLRTRFGQFAPDVVLVTFCLNDLVPSSGLCLLGPVPAPTGFKLLDFARRAMTRDPLELDASLDWVGLLLSLDEAAAANNGLVGPDHPYESLWNAGGPQRSITAMRDWCRDHNTKLAIILWPFLQGLGPRSAYPFRSLHTLVRGFCEGQGVPFLDVLSELQGTPSSELWVTPADMHANPKAQRLALPAIARFVAGNLQR